MTDDDVRALVRRGYDALSLRYRADDADPPEYAAWLDELASNLPGGAAVLDIGCGCGVPVARDLTARGYAVTGVDVSDVQIARARRLVPGAAFHRADALDLAFPDGGYDAIVCLYMLIHLPYPDQRELLSRFARWLRPGGRLLVTTGATAWTGTEDAWLGGTAPMWWSHPDAATYREWLGEAGFAIETDVHVPEGDGGHRLFRARRP